MHYAAAISRDQDKQKRFPTGTHGCTIKLTHVGLIRGDPEKKVRHFGLAKFNSDGVLHQNNL